MTATEIASLAISLAGGGRSLVDLDTDTSQQAETCRKWYAAARDECLASHPWNFAMQRTVLKQVAAPIESYDNNGTNTVVTTVGEHGLTTGQKVLMEGVENEPDLNDTWTITTVDSYSFRLDDSPPAAFFELDGGYYIKPVFGWKYQYNLPAGCLRVCNVNGMEANEEDSRPYAIEGSKLLTDESPVQLRYVYQHTTTAAWPQTFTNAFAYLLASYIATDLKGSAGKSMELRQMFETAIGPKAKGRDSRQGKGRRRQPIYDSDVVRARRGWNGSFIGY